MTPSRARGRPRSEQRSIAEREFPSDKVYRRDDRGIVGVEALSLQGLAFFFFHAVLPPRLPRVADRPAPEPHGEEPPPIAARSRWSRCRTWVVLSGTSVNVTPHSRRC